MIEDKDAPKFDGILRTVQMQRDAAQDLAALLAGDLAQAQTDLTQARQDNVDLRSELRNAKDRLRAQQAEIESLRPETGGVVHIGAAHA